MKRLAVLLVAAVALPAGTAGSAPPAFDYDRWFGTVAANSLSQAARDESGSIRPRVRGVGVRCYRTKESFEQTFERRAGVSAARVVAYYAGGRDVHLRNGTCANIRLFLDGRHTVLTAGAFAILLHESLHRQGLVHERLTTCFANEAVRWGALWLGFGEERALRARNLAFTYTNAYSPPSYRMGKPNCLLMTRRGEWVELARRTP